MKKILVVSLIKELSKYQYGTLIEDYGNSFLINAKIPSTQGDATICMGVLPNKQLQVSILHRGVNSTSFFDITNHNEMTIGGLVKGVGCYIDAILKIQLCSGIEYRQYTDQSFRENLVGCISEFLINGNNINGYNIENNDNVIVFSNQKITIQLYSTENKLKNNKNGLYINVDSNGNLEQDISYLFSK